MTPAQRFIRLATTSVVRVPGAWRLFRRAIRSNFDRLAPEWDGVRIDAARLVPLRTALESLPEPARVLDVGTGTGAAARLASEVWPAAEVTGVDLSPRMIDEARARGPQRYEVADASALPFPAGSFDLVQMNNMIPFFDEIARLVAPGGHVAIAFSLGADTPIYVPLPKIRAELERRGFGEARELGAGGGLALVAKRLA
jgi:SAM-dependent methyltransferase